MSNFLKKTLCILILISLMLSVGQPVLANIFDDIKKNLEEQARLNSLLSETIKKENTLKSQINTMDNQIRLTELKIDEAKNKIEVSRQQIESLGVDIGVLSVKVGRLSESLETISSVSAQRVRAIHQANFIPKFLLIFGSEGLDKTLNKFAYLDQVRKQDIKLLKQMKTTQENYTEKKQLLSDKKAEVEELKAQIEQEKKNLESRNLELASQKRDKENLLKLTKNDEDNYRRLLDAARKEQQQMQKAIAAANRSQQRKSVKKGEAIGLQGNTGSSTGSHLHFAVLKKPYDSYSDPVDPCAGFLACGGTSLDPTGVASGKYLLPLLNPAVSQGYGMTWFAKAGAYGGRPHTGIDMYAGDGDPVFAAEDGEAFIYRGGQAEGNGVFIYHPDGMMTLYWHLK